MAPRGAQARRAGGQDTITGWAGNDAIDLYGYGTTQPSQSVVNGSTVIGFVRRHQDHRLRRQWHRGKTKP